uniref:ribosomal protein L20 n=1 Tax=Meteora sporadica TaxID=2913902 RepID=UPI003002C244|nr:ribosomal protein L20 [Meteora sporadica]WVH37094.1 ribosomal protein L20 [Meteora sporadica]
MIYNKKSFQSRKKHTKILKHSKGFVGRANRCFRPAVKRVYKSWQYIYRDRRDKKRLNRKYAIQIINGALKNYGLNYNQFIYLLNCSNIKINRNMLSTLVKYEPYSFEVLVKYLQLLKLYN